MKTYGYVRVSSIDQNEKRQLMTMAEMGVDNKNIFIDKQSGKDFFRPAYQKLIKKLKPGDIVFIHSIDRLGRNYEEIRNQWNLITKNLGVDIVVVDMPLLDTRLNKDLMGNFIADLVLQILSFVAHNERDVIKKRQSEGIKAAKERGVHMGRPHKIPTKNFNKLIEKWKKGNLTSAELIDQSGLAKSTVYRRIRLYDVASTK